MYNKDNSHVVNSAVSSLGKYKKQTKYGTVPVSIYVQNIAIWLRLQILCNNWEEPNLTLFGFRSHYILDFNCC